MKECLEEAVIQAYVDGELSPEAAERVMTHAGRCKACAAALSDAENELALLAVAFEPELSLPVPTERLRERLDASLGEMRAQLVASDRASWNLKARLKSFAASFNFAPRQAIGFASLAAVITFAGIFAVIFSRQDHNQPSLLTAGNGRAVNSITRTQINNSDPVQTPPKAGVGVVLAGGPRADSSRSRRVPAAARQPRSTRTEAVNPAVAESQPLPGETSYLKTIASLSSIIETNGENAIKPSLRADYERNLALVNNAINATRRTARRNPKDSDAAEFLYSSYQSKIDLLSTVAEQGQMVAALR